LGTNRNETAVMTTLFRFAQYLGWAQLVYGYSDRLRFDEYEATKTVAWLIRDIGRTLTDDGLDRDNGSNFTTTRLMLWRDEQRAIGELMRKDGNEPECIGFESFVNSYDQSFARWFATFREELQHSSTPRSARLAQLQKVLAQPVAASWTTASPVWGP
jgi:hypothetical protein